MAKGYWKAVLAAAFFIVAGVCYGGSLFREGSIVLEGETAAGGAGVQTADGAEGSAPWADERRTWRCMVSRGCKAARTSGNK